MERDVNGDGEFEFFDLDANRLDQEWLNQPKLYHEYATKLADARRDHEQAKANLKLVESEARLRIRKNPTQYDLPKATEGAIEEVVVTQPDYRKALHKMLEAKHASEVLQATVDALDHRKKALEKLVELRLHDYYAEPRVRDRGSDNGRAFREDVKKMERKRGQRPA